MKKTMGLLLIVFMISKTILAQQNTLSTTGKWGTQIFLSDANGQAFVNKYDNIQGSAYFFPTYKYASIELRDGRKYMDIKAKLNLMENEVEFISATSKEGYLGKGMVATISFNDTLRQEVKKYIFQSGFPGIDNQTSIHFYQVLCNGKITFLKSINKTMEERKNELSGEQSKEFVTRENWYVYQNGTMARIKKDQAFFAGLFADKAQAFSKYINEHKLNFKKEEQIVGLVNYLNAQ
jgi:hypothetical protein